MCQGLNRIKCNSKLNKNTSYQFSTTNTQENFFDKERFTPFCDNVLIPQKPPSQSGKRDTECWVLWCRLIIKLFRKLKQRDHTFRPARAME